MADPPVPERPFVCAAEAALPPGWERTDPVPGTTNLTVAYDPRWHTMARLLDPPSPALADMLARAGFTPLTVAGADGFYVRDRRPHLHAEPDRAPATLRAASGGLAR